jgi:putative methylase
VSGMRPKHLAIRLSKLTPHPCKDVTLEQYATEGDLAAYWMLAVDQLDGLEGKVVADLGAGNGILGIGALLLGARRVVFVETDEDALEVLRSNVVSLGHELAQRAEVIAARVGVDDLPIDDVDLVVMNPPWGVQRERADRPFLEAAFNSAGLAVHLLHSDRASHVEAVAASHDWEAEAVLRTEFRLPPTYEHHAKRTGTTDVQCWRFHRTGDARLPQETDE